MSIPVSAAPKPVVLVVDPDPDFRAIVRLRLRADGYEVYEAPGGLDAWDLLPKISPDLVVMEMMLPGLDGFSLIQRIHATPEFASIPFVIVSARTADSDVRRGLVVGAEDYLTKPIDPKELSLRVRAVLRRVSASARPAGPDVSHSSEPLEPNGEAAPAALTEVERLAVAAHREIADLKARLEGLEWTAQVLEKAFSAFFAEFGQARRRLP